MKSRITWESVKDRSFEDLKHEAVERLNETSEGLIEWGHRAKDRNYPFLFQWQIDAPFNGFTHATSRVMAGLRRAGVLDKVISEDEKKLGLAWIRSIYDEASKNYIDPFLLSAKPRLFLEASAVNREKTGEDLPWPPTGAVREGLNHYSYMSYKLFGGDGEHYLETPEGWPRRKDAAETLWPWLASFGPVDMAHSWTGRVLDRAVAWYRDGYIDLEPIKKAILVLYKNQDPKTAIMGANHVRTFKMLITLWECLWDLPIQYPKTMINHHIDMLLSNSWDGENNEGYVNPCAEFDLWYNIGRAMDWVKGYREEEIRKLAAWRALRVIDDFVTGDKGMTTCPIPNPERFRLDGYWIVGDGNKSNTGDAFGVNMFSHALALYNGIIGGGSDTLFTDKWWSNQQPDDFLGFSGTQKVNDEIVGAVLKEYTPDLEDDHG